MGHSRSERLRPATACAFSRHRPRRGLPRHRTVRPDEKHTKHPGAQDRTVPGRQRHPRARLRHPCLLARQRGQRLPGLRGRQPGRANGNPQLRDDGLRAGSGGKTLNAATD